MTLVQLTPTDIVTDRPFTDLSHTTQDTQAIRFMVVCVGLVLGQLSELERAAGAVQFHQPSSESWVHRVVITQPERLLVQAPLTTVGFFGIKSAKANVPLAQRLDRQLIPELSNYDDLLAYATICLPTGNFANLVLFASPEGKDLWGQSTKHAEAIRLLTPDYYAAVRLYNGELPYGIADPDSLRLALVKYYDYGSHPLWRAVRSLQSGAQA